MDNPDPLLSELCSICHINPPKYRCPRCSTRTCSLPCTRRHKLWSQCSGVRDPAAYLKRSELATPSAFDRDFNFISGIERSIERAERDAENRGIEVAAGTVDPGEGSGEQSQIPGAGQKRKHPGQGLVKGEAGFLRGAEAGGVRVVRAPRGMSRNKANGSRWHPKHKCLTWSIEWISADGEKVVRNCLETGILSEAYNRAFPLPKEERPISAIAQEKKHGEQRDEGASTSLDQSDVQAASEATPTTDPSKEQQTTQPSTSSSVEKSKEVTEEEPPKLPIVPHRDVFFYIHRPQTKTKKPVLAPLPPSATLGSVLRGRTVLEFPTIYALADSTERLLAESEEGPFIIEEKYLQTADPEEIGDKSEDLEPEHTESENDTGSGLQNLDENKVLEVLKQDLFEPIPEGEAS